jgi:CelD/BcsL family acetyltransferase involved in cellulose biosynthesis
MTERTASDCELKLTVGEDIDEIYTVAGLYHQGSSYVFQTADWLQCWLNTFGKKVSVVPKIFLFEEGLSGARAILPLSIRRVGGIKILTTLGGFHSDYSGIRIEDREYRLPAKVYWEKLHRWATENGIDFVSVRRIPTKIGDTVNPLVANNLVRCEQTGQLDISDGWEIFYRLRMKTRLRADIRRQQKRLTEIGKLEFAVASTLEEALLFTDIMIQQKQQRYLEMGITNQFKDEEAKYFYKLATKKLWMDGDIHVAALKIGEEVIATHWGARSQGHFYYLMPTHAGGDWAKYSPGKVLLQYLVEWACINQDVTFDFTVGAESYKADWCDSSMPLYRYEIPITLKGRIFSHALALRDRIKSRSLASMRTR